MTTPKDVLNENPYRDHPSLSALEAEVLWEYAKLAYHIKLLSSQAHKLTEEPDETLLPRLRVLEKKMGLVLTLFKASVWGVINEQPSFDPDNVPDNTIRQ